MELQSGMNIWVQRVGFGVNFNDLGLDIFNYTLTQYLSQPFQMPILIH